MRRTFLSFNKDGRAEERLNGFLSVVQEPKANFMTRRQGLCMREEEMFLVDEDLLLNHLLAGTSLKYDAEAVTLQGVFDGRAEVDNVVRISLELLRDDFGERQKKDPNYVDWDSKLPAFRGD
ncbi:hypothetical protein C3747_78g281c [Trypanosoma cruzi]|uniref:Uncharacterized protein n=2 Tax=Trypanosoma cruzi TaxID=5693 RepID=Q4E5M9_TRYCC|nr:hypothetical protein, conserved [Trypanosoma cruzi]AAN78340.1 TcC31.17 [Trypanosoma cruzi]EAO00120.1 hypothetical protein, conserved [Trypanosoma cruzi]KAF8300268.1 hypothetical protein TcYC6_0060490 [Trypanosoma cruzi]PWV09494.1 hypothetical protein C3747_78g281c [Trypanosoma cruzi]RNC59966.1 hypothetical protein TcCL_ESM02303 [Trypanosoma cruzi]|eukprot:XP_821971.1 hypothetical protein [Trypanosoma cruzi strain CL Brener]